MLLFMSSDIFSSPSKVLYVSIGFSNQQSSAFDFLRRSLIRLLCLPDQSPLVIAVSWVFGEMLRELLVRAFLALMSALLPSYVASFPAVIRRDAILFWCYESFFQDSPYYGFPKYLLAVFRMSMIILFKNDNDLLYGGSAYSFIRWCGHIFLAFHKRGILVLMWCLVLCICSYQYSP